MTFDQPFAFRAVNAILGSRGDSFIDQPIIKREPNFTTPGAGADDFSQSQAFEPFGECLAVGAGAFVAQDHQMAAKSVLHVPDGIPNARLPVKPGFAQQLFEDPTVNVAAPIVSHVNDQSFAI